FSLVFLSFPTRRSSDLLIPCFLTAIIIYFGQFYYNNFILTNSLSIWLGKISYPLYLWHWPIIAFLNFYMIKWTVLNQFLVIFITDRKSTRLNSIHVKIS